MKKLIPQAIRNIYHLAQAILANLWFGFPSRKIKIIGVTGTNGKTTTCQMIAKILEEAGFKVALASTINFRLGEDEWKNITKFTTLSAFATQRFIHRAAYDKCDYLVLETSSHSLDQNRVWGVKYDTAVITNVTREHLDYHKSMQSYRKVKMKLFRQAKSAVVNLDMEKPEEFLQFNNSPKIVYTRYKEVVVNTNGMVEVKAENINLNLTSSQFTVHSLRLICQGSLISKTRWRLSGWRLRKISVWKRPPRRWKKFSLFRGDWNSYRIILA